MRDSSGTSTPRSLVSLHLPRCICLILAEVNDRIFSTAIDLNYDIKLPSGPLTIDGLSAVGEKAKFSELQASVRKITLETFATDESASVQVKLCSTSWVSY